MLATDVRGLNYAYTFWREMHAMN